MKTRTILLTVIVAITAIGLAQIASATGVLIPKDESVAPLAIKYQRVTAEIMDSVAHTHIEQAFTNSTNQQLEATYIFPLPKDASTGLELCWASCPDHSQQRVAGLLHSWERLVRPLGST